MNYPMKAARYWRDRAEETRAKAESFRLTARDRELMLKIAAEYDQLADQAKEQETK